MGDDVTDEDVFALEAPWLLGIRVGRGGRTSARFWLRRQVDIDGLLDVLIRCRRRSTA